MNRRKKRFKIRYVVLGVLLVLVIAAAAVIGTHWDLIKAAKMGLTSDSESIAAEQQKRDQEIQDTLGVSGLITDDMIAQAIAEIEQSWAGEEAGETGTEAEAAQNGGEQAASTEQTGQAQSSGQFQQNGGSGSTGSGSSTGSSSGSTGSGSGSFAGTQQTGSDIVVKYTTKLYGLRGAYQGRISSVISSAKAEYAALPAEQQTSSAQSAILASKMGQAEAIEAECDAQVSALLGEMSAELTAAGQSTESVSQLKSYYEDTKASQKAAYLAEARGR